MDGSSFTIEKDLTVIECVDAADAFHQGRFAGAVVPKQGQHLAAMSFEADILQRVHRAEALLRMTDRENRGRRGRSHCVLAACMARARASR